MVMYLNVLINYLSNINCNYGLHKLNKVVLPRVVPRPRRPMQFQGDHILGW